MSNKPNFKTCQYLDRISGICRMATASEEASKQLANNRVSIQCCFLTPVPTYSCPNPIINPQVEESIQEEPQKEDLAHSIHNLRKFNYDSDIMDSVIEILDTFRKEINILKESIKQENEEKLKTLENRIKSIEKILIAEKKASILFPTSEAERPRPIKRQSKISEKSLEFTDPEKAEKELEEKISLTLNISEDLFKDDFFDKENLNLEEDFDEN
jgi:hypothetical protein